MSAKNCHDIKETLNTGLGKIFTGDSLNFMRQKVADDSIDLIMTSPPFCLLREKEYGNKKEDYLDWFEEFAKEFFRILKPSGSLVIDLGGSWKAGIPTRSLYQFELLIRLCKNHDFHLAQDFYWWNPSRLPTPAEWVNVRRVRVKDAVNVIWWLSKTPFPKASNRRVLAPYSQSQLQLFENGYKPRLRPSGHDISTKFGSNNGGAIPPNLIAVANTESNSYYQRYCKEQGIRPHPARFPIDIPGFFIRMLTDQGDTVFDPFAGSCVTGEAAERQSRRWICCELEERYTSGARGRFLPATAETSNPEKNGKDKRRTYAVVAPNLNLLTEAESPLMEDGGKNRPEKPEAVSGD